jgi:acetyl-CoA acetyltransferase
MSPRIGVTGVGWSGFTPTTAGRSYKELMFEAAAAAYLDAGIDPRRDVDSFVCASEDLEEGTSIFDEYVPDQLGAVQRPVQTVASDGLFALATGVMLIRSGAARVVAVEAHSKASDLLTQGRVDAFALDPVLNRPLGVPALAIAGLEMRCYLHATGRDAKECAAVAERSREHARSNRRASIGEPTDEDTATFEPLTTHQTARSVDGCVVIVLATEERANERAVWVDGVGWSQDAPSIESRETARRHPTPPPRPPTPRRRRSPGTSTPPRSTTRSRTSSSSTWTPWGWRSSTPTASTAPVVLSARATSTRRTGWLGCSPRSNSSAPATAALRSSNPGAACPARARPSPS